MTGRSAFFSFNSVSTDLGSFTSARDTFPIDPNEDSSHKPRSDKKGVKGSARGLRLVGDRRMIYCGIQFIAFSNVWGGYIDY